MRACAAIASLFLVFAFAARASADEPSATSGRIAIAVVGAPGERFAKRLGAELEAAGFQVIVIDPTDAAGAASPATRASLEAATRTAGAVAAVRAVATERGVEVWIADRGSGRTLVRELLREEGAPDQDGSLAVAAVELLRASLLEVDTAAARRVHAAALAPPPPIEPPRSPPEGAVVASPTTVRLSLAPALVLSPGGFGTAVSLDVGVAWMPSEHLGVDAFAAIALAHPTVTSGENRADLSAFLAGGGLRVLFASRASVWSPTADAGLAAAVLHSTGTAASGFVALETSTASLAPYVGGGIAFAPTPNFRAHADLKLAVTTRRVSVSFDGQRVATWGAPLVMPELGVDFGWF